MKDLKTYISESNTETFKDYKNYFINRLQHEFSQVNRIKDVTVGDVEWKYDENHKKYIYVAYIHGPWVEKYGKLYKQKEYDDVEWILLASDKKMTNESPVDKKTKEDIEYNIENNTKKQIERWEGKD